LHACPAAAIGFVPPPLLTATPFICWTGAVASAGGPKPQPASQGAAAAPPPQTAAPTTKPISATRPPYRTQEPPRIPRPSATTTQPQATPRPVARQVGVSAESARAVTLRIRWLSSVSRRRPRLMLARPGRPHGPEGLRARDSRCGARLGGSRGAHPVPGW